MKRSILVLVCVAAVQFGLAQSTVAFPGERIPYRAAHFAHRVAYKIDKHVIEPPRRFIVRHTNEGRE